MQPYVREYQEGDAEALAPLLRKEDVQEIHAASGLPPVEALRMSAEESAPSCALIGASGKVAALFGAVRDGWDNGIIWLLGSDEMVKGKTLRYFVSNVRQHIDALQSIYPLLYNYIDERNTVHVQWLKKMGFTFIHRHTEYGPLKMPFLEFVRLK